MARIPRLYRVASRHANGKTELRHYQGPEAADERAVRFRELDPTAAVTVTPSHPITYPRPQGDPSPLDVPETLVSRKLVNEFLLQLGVTPPAVQLVMFSEQEVVVEYQPDTTGKRAPKLWRASIIE